MEVGFWQVDERPGQPVGMGGFVGTFVEVGFPCYAGGGFDDGGVFFEDCDGQTVFERPCGRRLDFGVNDGRLRVGDFDGIEVGGCKFFHIDTAGDLMVEQDCAAAVGFEVEVAFRDVRAGGEEKFDATVGTDWGVVALLDGADVIVFDAEDDIDIVRVISDFELGLWKMRGFVAHKQSQRRGLYGVPLGLVPVGIDGQRGG